MAVAGSCWLDRSAAAVGTVERWLGRTTRREWLLLIPPGGAKDDWRATLLPVLETTRDEAEMETDGGEANRAGGEHCS